MTSIAREVSGLGGILLYRRKTARKISRASCGMMDVLEGRLLLAAVTWNSTSSGNWNVASNWSDDAVPDSSNAVIISQPGVVVTVSDTESAKRVTVTGGANAPTLEVSGGGLTLSGDSTVDGAILLDGGSINNAGTFALAGSAIWSNSSFSGGVWNIASSGTLTLSTNNFKDLDGGVVLNNSGTIIDNGTNVWRFFGNSMLNNLSGGVVDLNSTETLQDQSSGGSAINNESGATFENTGSGSSTTVPFDNQA